MIWIIATIFTVLLMLSIVVGVAIDSIFFGFVIVFGVSILGFVIYLKLPSKKDGASKEISIEYDKEKQTAKLYKRVGANLDGMNIKQYTNTYTKYNPSKLVYTGATVGGITTGGFHQTQAYLSETSMGASGGYYLEIKSLSWEADRLYDTFILKKIILTDELAKEAANDKRVKKFLQGNELVLSHSGNDSKLTSAEKDILQQAVRSGDVATQRNITQRAFIAKQLSWQECYDIKDWISGDLPNTKPQSDSGNETRRKHPSHCVHRDKNTHCTCQQSKTYQKACSSTSGCKFYKDDRD